MLETLEATTGNRFPRGLATPYRCDYDGVYYIANDIYDILRFIKSNNYRSCYATVYAFRQYDQQNRDKSTAIIDTIPYDFDDKDNPENALADLNKLLGWASRHDIQPRVHYSGSKGFHVFIDIEPVELKHPAETLKMFVEEMQSVADFKTIDMVVPGDLNRVIRIPNTLHRKTGRYCIALNPEIVPFLSIDDITIKAQQPSEYIPVRNPASGDVVEQLHGYDEYIDEQKRIADKEKAKIKSSKFAELLSTGGSCPAYDDLIVNGTVEGNRDHAVCGIIHWCKKHRMSEVEIALKLDEFRKKCNPQISSSYVQTKLRYHMKADYTYCYFLRAISDKCKTCGRGI